MLNKFRRAAEKLVAPYGKVTYAQAGEDMSLDFLADYAPSGFYVDVGCNHPLDGSHIGSIAKAGVV